MLNKALKVDIFGEQQGAQRKSVSQGERSSER